MQHYRRMANSLATTTWIAPGDYGCKHAAAATGRAWHRTRVEPTNATIRGSIRRWRRSDGHGGAARRFNASMQRARQVLRPVFGQRRGGFGQAPFVE